MPYAKNTTYFERREKAYTCLGKDLEIPQRRDLRRSYIGISEFYMKILQNSRIKVDQRVRDIVLDLTVLSFNYSRPK
jgi:hypothetical protein